MYYLVGVFFPSSILFRVTGLPEPFPATVGQRQHTPWTGGQTVVELCCTKKIKNKKQEKKLYFDHT